MNNCRRGPWTPAEDSQLMAIINTHGPENWVKVSEMMKHRSPKQCRERYHQNLKPSLNHSPITEEEGALINAMVSSVGRRWAEIARRLPGRSDNAVKNWWNGGANKRKRSSHRNDHSDSERSRPVVQNPGATLPPPQPSQHGYAVQPVEQYRVQQSGYFYSERQPQRQLPLPQDFPPRQVPAESFSQSRHQSERNLPQPLQITSPPYPYYLAYHQQPLPSPSGMSVASHDTPSLIPDQSPIASPSTPSVAPSRSGHRATQSYDSTNYRPAPLAPLEPPVDSEPCIRNDSLMTQPSPIVSQKLPPINQLVDATNIEYHCLSSRESIEKRPSSSRAHEQPAAPTSPMASSSPNRAKMDLKSIMA